MDDTSGLWPADLHLIGKEILRFHAVFWPAFLMAGDVPLPKRVFAHGWLLFENDKMSKSRGNIVRAEPIRQVMGLEALRYFLFREVVFGQDGSFSFDALVGRYNSELANGLGNLASRTLTMIKQYRDGVIPDPVGSRAFARRLGAERDRRRHPRLRAFEFSRGLEAIWSMLSDVDKFIVEQAPGSWRNPPSRARRSNWTMRSTPPPKRCGSRSRCCIPVLPESTANIWAQLGMTAAARNAGNREAGLGPVACPEQKIGMIAPVFPRIEAKSAIDRMRALEEEETARQAKLLGKPDRGERAVSRRDLSSRPRRRSTSKTSAKWISASARCSPPNASKARTNSCT